MKVKNILAFALALVKVPFLPLFSSELIIYH